MTDTNPQTLDGPDADKKVSRSAVDRAFGDFFSNLSGGLRLLTFRPIKGRFINTINQAIFLVFLDFCLSLLGDFISAAPPRLYDEFGLPILIVKSLIFLPILWLLSARRRPGSDFTALVVTIYSGIFFVSLSAVVYVAWIDPGLWRSDELDTPTGIFAIGLAFAQVVIIARGIHLHLAGNWVRNAIRTIVAIGCVAIVSESGVPENYVWNTDHLTATEPDQRVDVEYIYYQQDRLVSEAVESLAEERPGIRDLYFVAAAPDAGNDVFRSEVRKVRRMFDEQFDTKDRSILLINDPAATTDQPLANFYNLQNAFYQIGNRINPDEDVVFMFLTSHGYKQAALSASLDWINPNAIWAEDLRMALDRSAIKWRVVVISACYSGSFIEHLKNDNTLIITASRRDRASFGCANGRDFTEFGKAFFNEHLRQEISFFAAFDGAKATIEKREADRNLTASEPQIEVGANIRAHLERIFRRLEGLKGPAISAAN